MMPLRQLGNAHPGSYAFDCELDTLQQSSLTLIPLHDFSPNFRELLFGSDHRIANWCSQKSPPHRVCLICGGNEVSKMSMRRCGLRCPPENFIEQGTCR
jgi:hypothetical protein